MSAAGVSGAGRAPEKGSRQYGDVAIGKKITGERLVVFAYAQPVVKTAIRILHGEPRSQYGCHGGEFLPISRPVGDDVILIEPGRRARPLGVRG